MNHALRKNILQKGFTLVELLVAVAIFMVVTVSTLGAFLSMIDLSKKVQNVRVAMDNANLAMETMMRNIRLGYSYCIEGNTGCSSNTIVFRDQNNRQVTYSFASEQVGTPDAERLGKGYIQGSVDGGVFVRITSEEIDIQEVEFVVSGEALTDNNTQPSIKIFIKGKTTLPNIKDKLNFDFVFQSLATQRLYDK